MIDVCSVDTITVYQLLLSEIKIWSTLRHDHVLPFYGASVAAKPPFLVSRYMKNGNVVKYLQRHPNSNRVKLVFSCCLTPQAPNF
jgi:serine/threonine protein kinase